MLHQYQSQLHTLAFTIIFILLGNNIFAQQATYQRQRPSISIKKAKAPIKIDGLSDEADWLQAMKTSAFHQNRPYDSSLAVLKSEVRLTFDDQNLYVFGRIWQDRNTYTVSSLKRDFEGSTSDVFTVNLDTFHDRLNAFHFAVSPLNIQREGLVVFGEDLSTFWDNKWYSAVKNYDDHWDVEVAIPFKSIRYKVNEANVWGLNFGRNTLAANEVSTWAPVPRNFRPGNVAFAGDLIWDDAPPVPGANISIIPYVAANTSRDYPRTEELAIEPKVSNSKLSAGFDAKIGIGPSLNLDLTFNPDFSNVEVDRQQTNLSRFELFFPERRQFFLENNDLFGTFGFPETRPFFTRRLGIGYNATLGQNVQIGIIGGARLSGKLNNNLRVGLMNLQTRKADFGNDNIYPGANYTVAVLQQKVLERSTIGGIFINKLNDLDGIEGQNYKPYNRVAGLEFNYFSKNNKFEMETYYHQSFGPNQGKDGSSLAHYLGYNNEYIQARLGLTRVGADYNAETGFVPRQGIYQLFRPMEFFYYPKKASVSKHINKFSVGMFQSNDIFDLTGKHIESSNNVFLAAESPAGTNMYVGYNWDYTFLYDPFDPTNSAINPNPDKSKNIVELPIGSYHYNYFVWGFESSQRKNIFGEISLNSGEFFNGRSFNMDGELSYRIQPLGTFTLAANYTNLVFPKPYNSAKYWLVGPRMELSLSRSVFFSNFFQFNTQTNNFNINSRLQWRFAPASDMFLVYTDNRFAQRISPYQVDAFDPRNKALVFKFTYWFNV